MSFMDNEEEETESDFENDDANPGDLMVKSSKKKKLKRFDFVTKGGEHVYFTADKIEEQERIEESLKAELAKQEVEKVKNDLVDLIGIDVVTKYYKNKGPITLNVYREDGIIKVIPYFKIGNNQSKGEGEGGPKWGVRSKFEDELGFMLEKKFHTKGIGEMLDQHYFVVLEMDEDELFLIILGRPFLATARAIIDVHEGKLSLRVNNETFTFNIVKSIKSRLLEVLRNQKGAIAWSITDIKGIDSSLCTHKILMEDEFKPSVQPQRWVNPNIKEVRKKEVIKLLDAGLIYLTSDSPWIGRCRLRLCATQATTLSEQYSGKGKTNTFSPYTTLENNERSTRKLHNNREGAFRCCFRIRQVPTILGPIQNYRLYISLYLTVPLHKARCKASVDKMDLTTSRI
uniref:DNA-directed DNA polymerase n=1 Tax=Tanacetum cinerariifolium TaxID=118510 RepID=A0A699HSI9_TANCI|nr:DNA-directed DNA polymerase [Tanacetum cinerariifolium]